MSKQILDELQFEKNKREILKRSQPNKDVMFNVQKKDGRLHDQMSGDETKKYAWEYELENYRKSKLLDKFHTFGAICGILALLATILINWDLLIQFLMKF